jgi:perosamine synthetase
VTLVEDSAESLGGRYKNRPVGVAGLVGCLSFNGNKVITTGGGGMLLTNDAAVAARARSLTTQARADALEWIHHDVAYNYRLTNLQAALGVAQLEQLGAFVEDKRRTAAAYAAAVAGLDGVQMFAEQPWARSTYWMPSVLLDPRQFGAARDVVRAANTDGIGLRPLWYPLHRQPVFADRQAYRIEVADDLHARGLSLPCSVGITEDERARVIDRLSRCRRAR